MRKTITMFFVVLIVLGMAAMVAGSSKGEKMDEGIDMEAAKASFEEYCGKCHGLDRALEKKKDKDGWEKTVERMSGYHKRFGDRIPEDDEDSITAYLTGVAGK